MNPQMERRFADFLKSKNVVCNLSAGGWEDAIAQLAKLLHKNEGGFDKDSVIEACIERERATTTVIAPKLAIPHARVDQLDKILVAIGTCTDGISFSDAERGLVHVVILILTPKSDPGLYLQALAALTRDMGEPDATECLLKCKTPKEVCKFFSKSIGSLPPYLKAENLMNEEPITIFEHDDLKTVIDCFCVNKVSTLPVVDEEGDLRGVVSLEDLLRLSLPEHLLWMHDLTPILRFEPFADLLRGDRESNVSDFMSEDYITVAAHVPAIQLAKVFLTENVRQILVVDDKKLVGTVDIDAFVSKVFWA